MAPTISSSWQTCMAAGDLNSTFIHFRSLQLLLTTSIYTDLCTACQTYLAVFASDASNHSQWECDEGPNDQDNADCSKGQRCSGVVGNGDCVEERECDEQGPTEQGHSQQNIAHLQRIATVGVFCPDHVRKIRQMANSAQQCSASRHCRHYCKQAMSNQLLHECCLSSMRLMLPRFHTPELLLKACLQATCLLHILATAAKPDQCSGRGTNMQRRIMM